MLRECNREERRVHVVYRSSPDRVRALSHPVLLQPQ